MREHMQMLRTVSAQSKCSVDVDVQVSFCHDNKNPPLSGLRHQTSVAHRSTGLVALLNAVCHDSAVGALPGVRGFLLLGPRLTDTQSLRRREHEAK